MEIAGEGEDNWGDIVTAGEPADFSAMTLGEPDEWANHRRLIIRRQLPC
jgi:hypothetical protein